jgi:hypothetical protein
MTTTRNLLIIMVDQMRLPRTAYGDVPRQGVLFVTDDEITVPRPLDGDPHQIQNNEQYAFFLELVDLLVDGDLSIGLEPVPDLARGLVVQPNHVRTVRSGSWKLSRYFDPSGQVEPQWEMFNLAEDQDPMELCNLLDAHGPFPTPAPDLPPEQQSAVIAQAQTLHDLLTELEESLLAPCPGRRPLEPSGGTLRDPLTAPTLQWSQLKAHP